MRLWTLTPFIGKRTPEPASGSILVAAVDGQGHSYGQARRRPTRCATHQGAESQPEENGPPWAAVFTRARPWVRTPEQVVESLFRIQRQTPIDGQTPPRPEKQTGVGQFAQGQDRRQLRRWPRRCSGRDPEGIKTRVALTDGERALQILVEGTPRRHTDPGSVARAGENSGKPLMCFTPRGSLEAELWVLDRTLRILFGEVGQVVKGIRQSVTKTRGSSGPSARRCAASRTTYTAIALACVYDEYLAKGWPIASGPVEGRLQESHQGSHGTFRNALDGRDGRGHRQTQSHLLERGL